MVDSTLRDRIQEFIESEGKSCSFDPELITADYVYRMWGGSVAIEEIANAMSEIKNRRAFLGGSLENPSCDN